MSTETENLPSTGNDFAKQAAGAFAPPSGGVGFLTFVKSGDWEIDGEVVTGDTALIQAKMMSHGWQLWGEAGTPPEDAFSFVTQPRPDAMDSIDGFDNDGRETTFRPREALRLYGLLPEQEMQFKFDTSSQGGTRATGAFIQLVIQRAMKEDVYFHPLVKLGVDSYKHAKWGKIFFPTFEVLEWCDEFGTPEGGEKKSLPSGDEEAAAPKKKRRTRAA